MGIFNHMNTNPNNNNNNQYKTFFHNCLLQKIKKSYTSIYE